MPLHVVKGFNTYYNESNFNRNDGVVVLVRSGLDCVQRNVNLGKITML